jgi:hypothetical protein
MNKLNQILDNFTKVELDCGFFIRRGFEFEDDWGT